MKIISNAIIAGAVFGGHNVAIAQDLEAYAGVAISNAYVSQGLTYNESVTIQPYVELGYGGFYGGIWVTNADADLLGDSQEVDYYVGYRGSTGSFSYGLEYALYTFTADDFEEFDYELPDYSEFIASASYAVNDAFSVTGRAGYAPEVDDGEGNVVAVTDLSLTAKYHFDELTASATYGTIDDEADGWDYWSVGLSTYVSDRAYVSLDYIDSSIQDSTILVTFGIDFSLL